MVKLQSIIIIFQMVVVTVKAEFSPSFFNLISDQENSYLSMNCVGESPYSNVKCNFDKVSYSHPTESKIETEKQKHIELINKTSNDELLREFGAFCESIEQHSINILKNSKTIETTNATNDFLNDDISLCKCIDKYKGKNLSFIDYLNLKTYIYKISQYIYRDGEKKCVSEYLNSYYEKKKQTCKIRFQEFDTIFVRSGKNKWISNPGPEGLCDFVNITTIEKENDSDHTWSFSQIRVDGNKENEFCKGFTFNEPYSFSWKNSGLIKTTCKYIEMQ